ncbi:MAG: hypothetical protein Q9160_006405 [Pyrenula sp. 1 TL-2023]
MSLQILSNLHLESPQPQGAYSTFVITPKAPYLALLGDIGNITLHKSDDILGFLTRQLRQFRAVLFVPGNHEAYHSSWEDTLDLIRGFEREVRGDSELGEFVLLDRGEYTLPRTEVVVLGCSLFSAVPEERHMAVNLGLNDFRQTEDWDVDAHNEAHGRDLKWLNERVGELERADDDVKIVILSHWSPSRDGRAVEPKYARSPIASGFATDLSGEVCFRSGKVRVWAFGHTYYNCDFVVEREDGAGPLGLVANQRGYSFDQAEGYDGEKIVEV